MLNYELIIYTNRYGGWRRNILKERITAITMDLYKWLDKEEYEIDGNGYVHKENGMISHFDPPIISNIGNAW